MDPSAPSILELASTWQIISAVLMVWVVVATFAAPYISARQAAKWQQEQKRRELKLWVFSVLMQSRADQISSEVVRAYNLIDTVFHDALGVRDKWGEYYIALNDSRLNTKEGGRIWDDKRNDLLRAMAEEIGLGKDFRSEDFSRIYRPSGLMEQQELAFRQMQAHKEDLDQRAQQREQNNPPPLEEDEQ